MLVQHAAEQMSVLYSGRPSGSSLDLQGLNGTTEQLSEPRCAFKRIERFNVVVIVFQPLDLV